METDNLSLDVELHIDINAKIEEVFETMLRHLAEDNTGPGGTPMTMRLERRPGGRWYRDLGDDSGHLWGMVQVIKPPTLLEIYGPMFMSYPVSGHLELRLSDADGKTHVKLRHRAFGMIEDNHREGLSTGWQHFVDRLRERCE
jgi:uncharacterized protein YndB with AHSA1/START domain